MVGNHLPCERSVEVGCAWRQRRAVLLAFASEPVACWQLSKSKRKGGERQTQSTEKEGETIRPYCLDRLLSVGVMSTKTQSILSSHMRPRILTSQRFLPTIWKLSLFQQLSQPGGESCLGLTRPPAHSAPDGISFIENLCCDQAQV